MVVAEISVVMVGWLCLMALWAVQKCFLKVGQDLWVSGRACYMRTSLENIEEDIKAMR